jgi:putative peptidoglycan lipid II flippase
MQDTRTPLYLSLGSIPLNIFLSIILSHRYGVVGLAMSASIVACLETLALGLILRLRFGSFGEKKIFAGAWRMVVAGGIMIGALYPLISQFIPLYANDKGFLTLMPKFLLIVVVGAIAYIIPCYILRLNEAHDIARRTRELMARSLNLT